MSKTIFYSDYSAMAVSVSVAKKTIQFTIAPTLDGQKKQGRPTQGEKIYSWEQERAAFFSLSDTECAAICYYWDQIMQGKYVNPKENDPARTSTYQVLHFLNKQPSRFLIIPKQPQIIQISVLNPGKQMVGFVLRPFEVPVVRSFIEHGFRTLPFYSAFLDGIEAKKKYEEFNSKNSNGGTRQESQTYSGGDPYYEAHAPQQPAARPQQQSRPQYQGTPESQPESTPGGLSVGDLPPLDMDLGYGSTQSPASTPQSGPQGGSAVEKLDELNFRF